MKKPSKSSDSMSTRRFLQNLIQYLAFEVQDRGVPLYRTRLIKLLYLSEVEYYRAIGKRLTMLDWIRYKYGPFAFEIQEIGKSIGMDLVEEKTDFETGRGIRYRAEEPRDLDDWLPQYMKGAIDRVIDRWSDESLEVLLDYVYIDTEPMIGTAFGEQLDFSRIDPDRRPRVDEDLELSEESLARIKDLLSKHESITRPQIVADTDKDIAQAMVEIEGKPNLKNLKGSVRSSSDALEGRQEGRE